MRPASVLVVVLAATLAACGASPAAPASHAAPSEVGLIFDVRGAPATREQVVRACADADAVLVGEMHDHRAGLPYAAKLFEDVLAARPGAALALEFLERDAQPVVDQYAAGEIGREAFVAQTKQKSPTFDLGHGRMIDAAKRAHAPIVAANAPRAYVKRARVDGFDALRALPEAEQAMFVVPAELPGGAYRRAFAQAMGEHDVPGHESPKVDAFFRAQALWDATMADSVARQLARGSRPVVLVVGRFHVESDGGLVQLLRAAAPDAHVVSVVMVERAADVAPDEATFQIVVGPAEAHD